MDEAIRAAALEYHSQPHPGKISVVPSKPLSTQRDLALAYSPGVAAACEAIVEDPLAADKLTSRANLIGVVSNGTAVLGLGSIGALAGKPVMEGKGVLFKKFAGIDVFDIEVDERDPQKLVDIIAALEPTFGGINLEDIKAPECFYVERELRARMKIPVFHDDQHGTAIVVGAALLNGLRLQGKTLDQVKVVTSGAGAAALACLDMLVMLGVPLKNIWVTDIKGVVYEGRTEEMDPIKARYAQHTTVRTLAEVIDGADVFLGLSAAGVLKPEMVARMAEKPLIFALANPVPEIMPEVARSVRSDAIIATGRSDQPNQVNNVLCFPFIFRGALDVGATTINEEMKLAAVRAIAALAEAESSEVVAAAYGEEACAFGPEYIIPRPFDPRLILRVAPAVARAAIESGVARRLITDWDAYSQSLGNFVWQMGWIAKPVVEKARKAPRKIVFAEGDAERVLRAVQTIVDEGIAQPVLIGRPGPIRFCIERLGLRLQADTDFELVNPDTDPRFKELWSYYHSLMERRGVSVELAKAETRHRNTLIGALMLKLGWADGMICGTYGRHCEHLRYIDTVLGKRPGIQSNYAMNILNLPCRTVALCDTYVNYDPTAEQIFEMTCLAAEELTRFGITPRIALLSHSSFGTDETITAKKMRAARTMLCERRPDLAVEGEMQGDAALSHVIRLQVFPNAIMREDANLLIFPNLDAANIAFNLLKTAAGEGMTIGPILLGSNNPVHVLTPTATVRRIVNMTALTVVDAGTASRAPAV